MRQIDIDLVGFVLRNCAFASQVSTNRAKNNSTPMKTQKKRDKKQKKNCNEIYDNDYAEMNCEMANT